MQIHQLKQKHKSRKVKRVGRGGRKGTYSGRGMKGQKQRAGRKMVPIIRELIKRYPKLKGYRTFRFDKGVSVVNIDTLDKKFNDGDVVNPESLVKVGIVATIKGRGPRGCPKVKILGNGKLTKKLIVEKCALSQSAKKAIEKVNGTIR